MSIPSTESPGGLFFLPRKRRDGSLVWLAGAAALTVPALVFRIATPEAGPFADATVFGFAIVGAAFILSWAAEAAEKDISQAMAIAFLAFITVLPEYAVDLVFAWKAGADPSSDYVHYAAANMTGANRLLIGIGWPLVFLVFWTRRKGASGVLELGKATALDLGILAVATIYSFAIALQRHISLWDGGILLAIFIYYLWRSARANREGEVELVGPAAVIGDLPKASRRAATALLFVFSALVILLSAEPFADGIVHTGKKMGIDEFLLVQWVAPLASEAPEITVAVLFAIRGRPLVAMAALVSAKVNQWTLLVATLPAVYSVSFGEAARLPLDSRQVEEFFLTSAQSLFAILILARLRFYWPGAVLLFVLFITQLMIPIEGVRLGFAWAYLGLGVLLLGSSGEERRAFARLFPLAFSRGILRRPEGEGRG